MTNGAGFKAPPFCPNPSCAFHEKATASWQWERAGFYSRRVAPHRIQRYRCVHCKRYFSDQTFSADYWLKRPDLLLKLFHAATHCSGFRQMARALDCSPQTAMHQTGRLGRHSLLFHEQHRPKGPLEEPICVDGLRNFEFSQYHPSEFHIVVGKATHFIHGFTHSELRRMGTMTKEQVKHRTALEAEFGTPDKASIRNEVAKVLRIVTTGSGHVEIHSDENPEYPRAIKTLTHLMGCVHNAISSRAKRDSRNPLFAINAADKLVRHSMSNQKRETIAFSKTIASAVARMWVFVAWRNYLKWFSERKHGGSPAMRIGVAKHRWRAKRILGRRLFPTKIALPESWQPHYWGTLPTRQIPNGHVHRLKYAF